MRTVYLALLLCLLVAPADAQRRVTTPKEQFGFSIGDDYQLANYQQLMAYWRKLDRESDRMAVEEIGTTEEGRPMLMAVVTSPANHKQLRRYQEIARKLCLAEEVATEEAARKLAEEGKAVVWIDGGLHANETLGAQQLMETVYQLVSRSDAETKRILDDVIVLAVHANPDGHDLVADWYMRNADPTKRTLAGLPRLYQKYIGHDNNRDFYMSTQAETKAMNRVMYREWFPQIVYNHHQTGPAGTVLFMPPFRDPFNYAPDPLVQSGINLVAAAMETRFLAEGKPGFTSRTGARYSAWWNGGLRTTAYFHNMVGLLTETIGSPTPSVIPFVERYQLPRGDILAPIAPQTWRFRQSVEYSVTANFAVLDVASRYRTTFLMNIWRMGRGSIERGQRDTWTTTPRRLASVPETGSSEAKLRALRKPEWRDPRGYVIPADQPDFGTATKFVNALIETGVTVHRATADFEAGGRRYPADSYVVKSAQAFRPHVLDLFEPQDHPDDFAYAGAPPTAPYDSAGWTLAYQMGVKFDRFLEEFTGPFERLKDTAAPPPGRIASREQATAGYLLSHTPNDAFILTNRLLGAGKPVRWLREPLRTPAGTLPAGTVFIPAEEGTAAIVERAARELGLHFDGTNTAPPTPALELKSPRVGLWDRYGGSMPSGWTRWLLERCEFPYRLVFPPRLDAGALNNDFDVLVFPDGAIPSAFNTPRRTGPGADTEDEPAAASDEFSEQRGAISARTVARLKEFMEAGGTVVAIGDSTALGRHLGLPVSNHLVERGANGRETALPREKFYVPGSVLRVRVDNTVPLAWGLEEQVDVMFDNSPVFRLTDQRGAPARRVAWFDSAAPLRSGWAWGQKALEGGVAVAEVSVGKGRLYLFGPEIAFRAQPHGTFKFLFNALMLSAARE
jgi:hypothetical protein